MKKKCTIYMKYVIKILFLTLVAVNAKAQPAKSTQVEKIIFNAPSLYPEGIAYDAKGRQYFVSSVKTGTIGRVDTRGNYSVLYEDTALKSTFGMKVNSKRKQLWVCSGDPNYSIHSDSATFRKMAKIIVIDIPSGKKVKEIDLSHLANGKHFLNDIAFDSKGNAYVTDSFSPAIYKIDSKGQPSLFVQSDMFKSIDVGLNGVVVHPGGYLLVDHNKSGRLFRVTLKDPSKITVVKIPTFFPGADGLALDDKNNLILVQNKGADKIFLLKSADGWSTASIDAMTFVEDKFQHPTTVAWTKEGAFILNSKINELSDSTCVPSKSFSIQKAMFKPAN
jgi:sugar lactone lactonase YvrE